MIALKNVVIENLPRKSKNGTRFRFRNVASHQVVYGFGTVLKTTKDGQVTASVDGLTEPVTFHTKDKAVWPNATPKKA